MSAPSQPPLLEQIHRNHGLFSDHYLNETLPQRPDWQELVEEGKPVIETMVASPGGKALSKPPERLLCSL